MSSSAYETLIVYDDFWQSPAITEKRAYQRMKSRRAVIPENCTYFGFPWATLFDKLLNNPDAASPLMAELLQLAKKTQHRRRVVTVCQHIDMLNFQKLFHIAGITDIFWSHAVKQQELLPDYPKIRIHSFPLYPVQVAKPQIASTERSTLFSFVGARPKEFYLTQVRNYILDELAEDERGIIIGRNDWHYNKIVYDHQIRKRDGDADKLVDKQASNEFVKNLESSVFSLCPSGSGPNSIRLWESIGAGAAPVIMSDTHLLPGDLKLWETAAVFCPEEREAVIALPDRLEKIAADPILLEEKRHALRQLWMLYGPDCFTHDIEKFFIETAAENKNGSGLPLDDADLMDLSQQVLRPELDDIEADEFLLVAASSRTIIEPEKFAPLYGESETVRRALTTAAVRSAGRDSAAAWKRTAPRLVPHLKDYTEKADRNFLKICLFGRHANRTPTAYTPYKSLFQNHLKYVEDINVADCLVVGFDIDVVQNAEAIQRGRVTNPDLKLLILSEEPLWDTVWSRGTHEGRINIEAGGETFDCMVLNHETSDIFKFERLPYFITTSDHYFIRYANLFQRNAAMTPEELLQHWRNAEHRAAFFAEQRHDPKYDFQDSEGDLYGLSVYRTRVAQEMVGEGVLRCGKGWSSGVRRQDLPDWHLDKLAALDRRSFVVSALENTHQRNYITEKIFDAFAVLGVPLYYASDKHRITELVPESAFLNLFGKSAEEAAALAAHFEPDTAFAKTYLEAQRRLSALFADPEILLRERARVVDETVQAIENLSDS